MENLTRPRQSATLLSNNTYTKKVVLTHIRRNRKRQEKTLSGHKENLGKMYYLLNLLQKRANKQKTPQINIWTLNKTGSVCMAVPVCISFMLGVLSLKPSFSVRIEKVYTVAGSRLENVAASCTTF